MNASVSLAVCICVECVSLCVCVCMDVHVGLYACVYLGNGLLSYYLGNPEIGDRITAGHVRQGWDASCVLTTVTSN